MNDNHNQDQRSEIRSSASNEQTARDRLVGKTIAGVRVDRLLGKGGMAEVYLGHHLELDRPVALKILLSHLRDEPFQMEMLQKEAAALVAMQHPNIVQCVDCNVYRGRPFIIIELLQGVTLQDRLDALFSRGLRPSIQIVNAVIQSTASALDYAHRRGIIHRDLKPANLMLLGPEGPAAAEDLISPDVRVVLTDFGVARLLDATERAGMVVGTPAYMSPEQASARPVDARSDIYSLGVIAYQMLAGKNPYRWPIAYGDEARERHRIVLSLPIANTPGIIQRVVKRALAELPEERYPRARVFARSLREAVAGRLHE